MEKETLGEAAANLADPNICKTDNWIAGARWMAENMPIHILDVENTYVHIEDGVIVVEKNDKTKRMYSEEDLEKAFKHGILFKEESVSTCEEAIDAEFSALIEQFKKK